MRDWLIEEGGWALLLMIAFVVGILYYGYTREVACNEKGGIIVRGAFTTACVKAETL